MTASFWVPGPLPGMNEIIAANKAGYVRGRGYTVMKAQWTGLVSSLAKRNRVPKFRRVRLAFDWHETTRKRNPDNIAAAHKFCLDGLVEAGVLENDGWNEVAGWVDSFVVDEEPGVFIELIEVES